MGKFIKIEAHIDGRWNDTREGLLRTMSVRLRVDSIVSVEEVYPLVHIDDAEDCYAYRYFLISLINGRTYHVEDAEGYRILELLGGE